MGNEEQRLASGEKVLGGVQESLELFVGHRQSRIGENASDLFTPNTEIWLRTTRPPVQADQRAQRIAELKNLLIETDVDTSRSFEELVVVLVNKNLIGLDDLPSCLVGKILYRRKLRAELQYLVRVVEEA